MDNRPIGVFDSGIGGLTVLKEISEQLPYEDIIYFGDTARVPYGTRSKETVIKYSFQCINFLISKDIKLVVIACNTATASALEEVSKYFDIPIIGVVMPGVVSATETTQSKIHFPTEGKPTNPTSASTFNSISILCSSPVSPFCLNHRIS